MSRHTLLAMLVALVLLIGGSVTVAQVGGGYDLTWSSIDGGGGTFSTGRQLQPGRHHRRRPTPVP